MTPPVEAAEPGSFQSDGRRGAGIVAIAIGIAETIVLAMIYMPGGTLTPLMLVHAASVALLLLWCAVTLRRGRDAAIPALALVCSLAGGPIGIVLSGALGLLSRGPRGQEPRLLADWYARIANSISTDPVAQLCEHVAVGRAADLGDEPPVSYVDAMREGAIAERQTILGIIARSFHPDYLPVLRAALDNPEPVIRVQAAAVAARIRSGLKQTVDRLLEACRNPPLDVGERLALASTLELCTRSGLVDAITARSAGAAIDSVLGGIGESELSVWRVRAERGRWRPAGSMPVDILSSAARPLPSADWVDVPLRVASYERGLIRLGRFAALRRVRAMARATANRPHARLRHVTLRRMQAAPR
jgi:hypothetical protein